MALITSGSWNAAAVPSRSILSSSLSILPETSVASTSFKSTCCGAVAAEDADTSANSDAQVPIEAIRRNTFFVEIAIGQNLRFRSTKFERSLHLIPGAVYAPFDSEVEHFFGIGGAEP